MADGTKPHADASSGPGRGRDAIADAKVIEGQPTSGRLPQTVDFATADRQRIWLQSQERSDALRRAIRYYIGALVPLGFGVLAWSVARPEGTWWAETGRWWAAVILAGGGFIVAGIGWYTYTTAQFAYANQWIGRMKATADSAFEQVQDPSDVMGFLAANRKQMSTYDQIARDQASSSHRASTWAMVVGLLLVVSGIAAAIFGSDAASKYAAAIVTATCAATSGYIASTFIKVQSSTQDQMRYFFQEPLVQSYLLSAERLIGQMPGRTEEHIDQYHAVITAALAQAANVNQQIRTPGLRRAQQPRRRLRKASPGALPSRDAVEDDTQV